MPYQILFVFCMCAECIEIANIDGAFAHLFRQGTSRTGVEIQFDSDFRHVLLELGECILKIAENETVGGDHQLAGQGRMVGISLGHFGDQLVHSCQNMGRSEEHTSELQSLMRISYAVFCLKKKHSTNNTSERQ